ncbi:MAG: hypothetical protein KGL39_45870 [Patescibacteria group bacterium]|nr:hypothetical protein [Patescibacteria group bacterium]
MATPSAPSPELVAASPFIKQVIADLKAFNNTVFTGDPLQIGLRVGPALGILTNQVILLEPAVLGAEQSVIGQDLNSKLDAIAAKLP